MLDEGSSAALHSPITLGTCPSSPLIHLSSSSGSQSKARGTEMGREHLTPWKGHAWTITKADPWENLTHRRERPGAFGCPKQPHLPAWLSSGSVSSTHGEIPPKAGTAAICITGRYSSWVSLACRSTMGPHLRVCSMQLIPTRNPSGSLGEELWVCPAQGDISLLHGLQGSVMFCIC